VFKNPPGDSAGRLIDAAGAKGTRAGGAQVSPMHANFIVANAGASATDVWTLIRRVHRLVRDNMGVDLEPEVRFLGSFPDVS
jgi:UDP-N-acetylmuramate dehydrogenase